MIKKVSLHSEVVEQPAAVMFELTNDRSIRSSNPTSTPTSADGVGARGSEGEVSGGKAGGRAQDRHLSPLRRSRSPSNGMLEHLESETEEEMKVDQGYLEQNRKKVTTRRSSRAAQPPPSPSMSTEQLSTSEWELMQGLSKDEIALINKRRAKAAITRSKQQASRALTGEQANFPSLSHMWSQEVAMNMVFAMASRMRTFLWKKLLWQLRVKSAVDRMQGARWKRNPRWLAMLLSKEVGAIWGHYGALRQKLNNPDILYLM